ncbi:hypothetical protein ASPWEDRAFT_39499 [Aspergillus wentii DTO 134E9]|uniref:Uncharacterized protein n=1 Tax=Aspergillus wentii DTO 134E9 TaxID=1073089 RepID=A0A1L9RS96_ASPWE|nr:uncharacterized protein ASPWEDRAFT_39499 [Aspergillus wentii DTO 134E9]OJJ37753.1 hypothetical protein ASPWEDRAFT_39499 [Aspergillus wentii DTO 134E9]
MDRSRNIALFSILGVIGGAWLLFRAQAPKRNAYVVSDEERALMRGSDGNQTSQGNKTARAPRSLE